MDRLYNLIHSYRLDCDLLLDILYFVHKYFRMDFYISGSYKIYLVDILS